MLCFVKTVDYHNCSLFFSGVLIPNSGYSSVHHKSFAIFALVYPEHIFRMETFFLVSGFLACMIRSRKGKKVFFQARIKRVLLPLLLSCFGGNLLLQIFGAYYMDFAWKNFDLWRMIMHGWFLITLFVCACLDMLIPEKIYFSAWWKQFLIMLLIATAVYPLALYLNGKYWHFFGSIDGNLFNFFIVNTLQFFLFYYCGALLYARREFLHRITKKQIAILLIITML